MVFLWKKVEVKPLMLHRECFYVFSHFHFLLLPLNNSCDDVMKVSFSFLLPFSFLPLLTLRFAYNSLVFSSINSHFLMRPIKKHSFDWAICYAGCLVSWLLERFLIFNSYYVTDCRFHRREGWNCINQIFSFVHMLNDDVILIT